jgi:hypothetical protein
MDDIKDLAHLHEEGGEDEMIRFVDFRFNLAAEDHKRGRAPESIYTWAGSVLVAMNPFTPAGDAATASLYDLTTMGSKYPTSSSSAHA